MKEATRSTVNLIVKSLPSHPHPAAALFMLYWVSRADPQRRVVVTTNTLDDLRNFIEGIPSTTVLASLASALTEKHEETIGSIEIDMVFSAQEVAIIMDQIEVLIDAIKAIEPDNQDRIHIKTMKASIRNVLSQGLKAV
jgi:hypothetical protein